eukprot:1767568-Rhodomonas_salina.1
MPCARWALPRSSSRPQRSRERAAACSTRWRSFRRGPDTAGCCCFPQAAPPQPRAAIPSRRTRARPAPALGPLSPARQLKFAPLRSKTLP